MKITEQAHGKWRSILPMLGIDPRHLDGKHGPCPACDGGKDRFRFDDRHGGGQWICSQCGSGDGFELLKLVRGWSFKEAAREIEAVIGDAIAGPEPKAKMSAVKALRLAEELWSACVAIQPADEAGRYLAARGVSPPSRDLRFCGRCLVTGVDGVERLPAMVALVRGADGRGVNVHRTYLQRGRKAPIDSPRRLMAGTIPPGAAIRLEPHQGVLGIAEGIETALAASARFGVPCWSAINEGMLRGFEWPADLRELHVFGDNDANFVGQAAAYHLAARASRSRNPPRVRVHIPDRVGTDWADQELADAA